MRPSLSGCAPVTKWVADALATTLRGLGVTHVLYNQLLGRFFGRLYPEEENARLSAFAEEDLEMVGAAGGFALYRLRGGRAEMGSSSTIPSR